MQVLNQGKWQKRLTSFWSDELKLPADSVDRTVLPFALRRILTSSNSKKTPKRVALIVPDQSVAEELELGLAKLEMIEKSGRNFVLLPESSRGRLAIISDETKRAEALDRIASDPKCVIIGSIHAFAAPLPSPDKIGHNVILTSNMTLPLSELAKILVDMDYDDELEVTIPGEFARRGGLIDIFSPAETYPCRIDYFGDAIESLRPFDPVSQRSCGDKLKSYRLIIPRPTDVATKSGEYYDFFDHFPVTELTGIVFEPDECVENLHRFSPEREERWTRLLESSMLNFINANRGNGENAGIFPALAHLADFAGQAELQFGALEAMHLMLERMLEQYLARGYQIYLLAENQGNINHLKEWLTNHHLDFTAITIAIGNLPCGIIIPATKVLILTGKELFTANAFGYQSGAALEVEAPSADNAIAPADLFWSDLADGDYAVHLHHGIAIYQGIKELRQNNALREVMVLEFADGAMLYVPVLQANLVSRYLGSSGAVRLSKLGSNAWQNTQLKAQRSIKSYAADLLKIQAVRNVSQGIKFPKMSLEEKIFGSAFKFSETPDQLKAITDIFEDMEKSRPMDRLLCGDVGFGKTEVAMRAAFKAVSAGYQVAILAPTTVLVQQHYYSFRERFAEYPVNIESLSRLKTPAAQREVWQKLADGKVDIVIGTHALCGRQVNFRNLGLLVIDEEQRFGVKHKEYLRSLRTEVDVLSMSATPIPRTMYLAMAGARDLSTLLTAPQSRLPVKTIIASLTDDLIVDAINAEIKRKGQIYLLHNRVETIAERASYLKKMLPEVRFGVAHGQLENKELSEVMTAFLDGKIDCLVCSTIIESGLDVPNANTIIIENADRFGLAELYQLRGRVGRWKHNAFAYLLLPNHQILTGDARKRIAAIRRSSQLGSGLQLAMRDLEIRGAGNLLGAEQSGHLNAIGFDLYCHLLKAEVAKLKGKSVKFLPEVNLAIDFVVFADRAPQGKIAAAFPPGFIGDERMRIAMYRKLSSLTETAEIDDFSAELLDRFGPLPEPTKNLLVLAKIKLLTALGGFNALQLDAEGTVYLKYGNHIYKKDGKLPRIGKSNPPELKLLHLLKITLDCLKK